jgi:hypothetical protein
MDRLAAALLTLMVVALLAWPALALVAEWWAPSAAITAANAGIESPLLLLARPQGLLARAK